MTVTDMFGPLYHAAAERGIAAAVLDESPPHVVAMMLHAPTTQEEMDQQTNGEVMRAKVAARRAGQTFDVMTVPR